jgi:membrane protein YqaA with SNARE-associated domain
MRFSSQSGFVVQSRPAAVRYVVWRRTATRAASVAGAGALLGSVVSWALGGMATVLGYRGVMGIEYALQTRAVQDGA